MIRTLKAGGNKNYNAKRTASSESIIIDK